MEVGAPGSRLVCLWCSQGASCGLGTSLGVEGVTGNVKRNLSPCVYGLVDGTARGKGKQTKHGVFEGVQNRRDQAGRGTGTDGARDGPVRDGFEKPSLRRQRRRRVLEVRGQRCRYHGAGGPGGRDSQGEDLRAGPGGPCGWSRVTGDNGSGGVEGVAGIAPEGCSRRAVGSPWGLRLFRE